MAYLHIDNLYKDQTILMFKECYALEKVHGTSAHIAWKDRRVRYFSGGASHELFVGLFDESSLIEQFAIVGADNIIIYGEAYGGKMQGMRDTYGDKLRFIVFDVKIGGIWLSVPQMNDVTTVMKLEVVPWTLIESSMQAIDEQRGLVSRVGTRRGYPDKKREGIVLRPLVELTRNNGKRIIAKHKQDDFRETKIPRYVSEEELQVLTDADKIAEEWVTPMRLTHVLASVSASLAGEPVQIENTRLVIAAMVEDVEREAEGEIIMGKATRRAISRTAASLFKARLQESLYKEANNENKSD